MAERLTEFNKTGWVLKLDEPQNEFEARQQLMSKFKFACEKLGKIEDLLEKYVIESVEELDNALFQRIVSIDNPFVKGYVQAKIDAINRAEQDRDTWKRACELASETLKQVMGKPLWIGGNIPTPEVKDSDYFYQQAKTEGNDEN